PGLKILEVRRIDPKASAQVRRVCYRVPLISAAIDDLGQRAADLLAASELWVERTRPHARRFNLRPYLSDLRVLPDALAIELYVTPTGAARPDEVLHLLGLGALLDAGVVIERTAVEIHDEYPAAGADTPVVGIAAGGP